MRARHVPRGRARSDWRLPTAPRADRAARGADPGSFRTSAARAPRRAGTCTARRRAHGRCRRRRSSASNASRALAGVRSAPCHGNGDEEITACRKRSGVVAQRSTSMYCAAPRPSALAQPLQQPGPACAAAAQNHRDSRGRRLERALNPPLEPCLWTRHSFLPPAPWQGLTAAGRSEAEASGCATFAHRDPHAARSLPWPIASG